MSEHGQPNRSGPVTQIQPPLGGQEPPPSEGVAAAGAPDAGSLGDETPKAPGTGPNSPSWNLPTQLTTGAQALSAPPEKAAEPSIYTAEAPSQAGPRSAASRTSEFALGGLKDALQLSVPVEDLGEDRLLKTAGRLDWNGRSCPALGGIPLLAKLGQGGMGAVYYGMHSRLRKEVAVKVLPLQLGAGKPDLVQRFVREAQLAAQIQSPHLVAVMDVNEEDGLFYIVMEFVRGETSGAVAKKALKERQTGLPEEEALEICVAATRGLAMAHDEGIIHRDIKPDNILIPRSKGSGKLLYDQAKLADLGLARNTAANSNLTMADAGMGTPGYMAPEQAMEAQSANKPADVFGMGATLYSLLTGRPPFPGENPMRIIFNTVEGKPTPLAQVRKDASPLICALIERCLQKDPAERFAEGGSLLEALQACLRAQQRTPEEQRKVAEAQGLRWPSADPEPSAGGSPGKVAGAAAERPARDPHPAPEEGLLEEAPRPEGGSAAQEPAEKPEEEDSGEAEEEGEGDEPQEQKAAGEREGSKSGRPSDSFGGMATRIFSLMSSTAASSLRSMRYSGALSRGRKALKARQWGEAKKAFKGALKERPGDLEAQKGIEEAEAGANETWFQKALKEGDSALKRQEWAVAVESYQKALKKRPENKKAQDGLQRAREGEVDAQIAGNLQQAVRMLQGYPESPLGLFEGIPDHVLREVETQLDTVLRIKPGSKEALDLKAKLPDPERLALDLGNDLEVLFRRVSKGSFKMGAWDGSENERPPHPVLISRTFYISQSPITVRQFMRFVEETRHRTDAQRFYNGQTLEGGEWKAVASAHWANPGFRQGEDHPVVLVSWNDAKAFAKWASKSGKLSWPSRQKGLEIQLPTEAQWEYAARGTSSGKFPWGSGWEGKQANHADLNLRTQGIRMGTSSDDDGFAFTSPVEHYDNRSWCGVYDLSGNVWEWCQDWYGENYYTNSPHEDPRGPGVGQERVVRGGSWSDPPMKLRTTSRRGASPDSSHANVGFRIILCWEDYTLEPPPAAG